MYKNAAFATCLKYNTISYNTPKNNKNHLRKLSSSGLSCSERSTVLIYFVKEAWYHAKWIYVSVSYVFPQCNPAGGYQCSVRNNYFPAHSSEITPAAPWWRQSVPLKCWYPSSIFRLGFSLENEGNIILQTYRYSSIKPHGVINHQSTILISTTIKTLNICIDAVYCWLVLSTTNKQ